MPSDYNVNVLTTSRRCPPLISSLSPWYDLELDKHVCLVFMNVYMQVCVCQNGCKCNKDFSAAFISVVNQ